MNDKILLPGSEKQLILTLQKLSLEKPRILVIGSFSENAAKALSEKYNTDVNLIVEDTDSLMNANLIVGSSGNIKTGLMSYEVTDFKNSEFDLIYAQASISGFNRNKIVKEIKRILKPGGYLSVGEITRLAAEIPSFVQNAFKSSNLDPLFIQEISHYYTERNFKLVESADLTSTLKEYYTASAQKLTDALSALTENEKKYYKKLLNKISHETNIYLKLGGDKFIGFTHLLLQKGENWTKVN